MDISNIYRLLHLVTAEYTFLNSHVTFTKIDHILAYRTHFNKFKRIEITVFLSDYKGIKLGISNRKITGKSRNTGRLNNTCLNNTWVEVQILTKLKIF